MLLKKIGIIVCGLFAFAANAQQTLQLVPERILKDSISDFAVDNLGNLYLFTGLQQLKKLDDKYDSVTVFNNVRRYGKLTAIDAGNPLRILLFYQDFNTVLVLDRFLSVRSTIDLRQSNILQCTAIAQSYDNNIWVYDDLANKMKKVDDNGQVLLESPDLRILYDAPPRPVKIEDYNRYVYAYDSTRGLLVMDYFGAIKNLVAFTGWQNMHGISKGIAATDSTGIIYYEPGTLNTQHYDLPAAVLHAGKLRIHGNKLYALEADGRLHIYQWQQ